MGRQTQTAILYNKMAGKFSIRKLLLAAEKICH